MASRILRCAPALMRCDVDRGGACASRARTSSVSPRDAARSASPFLRRRLRGRDALHQRAQFVATSRGRLTLLRFASMKSASVGGVFTL
ncbi:hypothetical protein [Rugamonas rivuli]|uniref:Uncharacterized protein n=1 Tax=Rugamonas rivuli TaxID=2743358 RepID=A0A843SGV7_9BURK|nr:hypothetical protein [Rugamonas rivuli]MQA21381.1 hypothetical protein [Rugamonas rivuli]